MRGRVFKHNGINWKVLNTSGGGVTCVAEEVKKVRFDAGTNNWERSELRNMLNGEFLKKTMFGAEMETMKTDMKALDGKTYGCSEDFVRIMTLDDYRENRDIFPEIHEMGEFFWLATPWTDKGNMLCVVTPLGTVEGLSCDNKLAVRPVCKFTQEFVEMKMK